MKSQASNVRFINLVLVILYWIVLQDFILALLYKVSGSFLLTNLFFYVKDVLFVGLVIYVLLRFKIPTVLMVSFIGITFCVILGAFVAIISYEIKLSLLLQNIRNIILLVGFMIIGYGIKDRDYFKKKLLYRYFPFLVFCAIVAILEYYLDVFIGTKEFWLNVVGITDFYTDIKGQAGRLLYGFPGNFYGDYGNGFFSSKRLVGFWMGPLTSAYALLIPTIFYFLEIVRYKNLSKTNILSAIILIFAIYLTHTRAIIIPFIAIAGFEIIITLKKHLCPKYFFTIIAILLLFIAIIVIIKFDDIYHRLYDGSTAGHIIAIQESISIIGIDLFGHGLGFLGINGKVATESMYLTIYGNLGLMGLVFYLLPLLVCLWKLFKYKNKTSLLFTIFYAGICYAFTGFISEQLSAYTCIAPFFVLAGYSMERTCKRCSIHMSKQVSVNLICEK